MTFRDEGQLRAEMTYAGKFFLEAEKGTHCQGILFQVRLAAMTDSLSILVLNYFLLTPILGLEMRKKLLFGLRNNEEFLSRKNNNFLTWH